MRSTQTRFLALTLKHDPIEKHTHLRLGGQRAGQWLKEGGGSKIKGAKENSIGEDAKPGMHEFFIGKHARRCKTQRHLRNVHRRTQLCYITIKMYF